MRIVFICLKLVYFVHYMVTFNFVLTKGDCLSTHDCSQPWNIPPSKAVYITAGDQDKKQRGTTPESPGEFFQAVLHHYHNYRKPELQRCVTDLITRLKARV